MKSADDDIREMAREVTRRFLIVAPKLASYPTRAMGKLRDLGEHQARLAIFEHQIYLESNLSELPLRLLEANFFLEAQRLHDSEIFIKNFIKSMKSSTETCISDGLSKSDITQTKTQYGNVVARFNNDLNQHQEIVNAIGAIGGDCNTLVQKFHDRQVIGSRYPLSGVQIAVEEILLDLKFAIYCIWNRCWYIDRFDTCI